MLAGEPKEDDPDARNQVIGLVQYIADYVMERYLHKFSAEQNYLREKSQQAEVVKEKETTTTATVTPSPSKKPGRQDAPRLKLEHDAGTGWDKLGEKYGCSGNWIKKLVRRYEAELERKAGGSENQ